LSVYAQVSGLDAYWSGVSLTQGEAANLASVEHPQIALDGERDGAGITWPDGRGRDKRS